MKAILVREFGGPDVLRLEDVPDPKPGPSEVVVRIRAAGVNPVDTYIRSGTYARKPPLPYIPGSDGAGEIEVANATVGGRSHLVAQANVQREVGQNVEIVLDELREVPIPGRIHSG